MISSFLKSIFGTKSQRDIKKLNPIVEQVNSYENTFAAMSDEDLKNQTNVFKQKISQVMDPIYLDIEEFKKQEEYDDEILKEKEKQALKKQEDILLEILPEAFAVVREASKRVLKMRHFDVQIMGGIILHQGRITEMVTGEGKTLVATLPTYLNALTGKGVHVVTVNDYLAERDRKWMGPIHEFLGLTVGVIKHNINQADRHAAYASDITYGTNNEFGFDYLRDNMVTSVEDRVQRPLHYCIVDEVDSILIDESRTPLIISGPVDTISYCYNEIKDQVRSLVSKQSVLIRDFIANLEKAIAEEKDEETEKWLYLLHRGAPKDKEFLSKILNNPQLKRKLEHANLSYARKEMLKERLTMEEALYYTYEEKSREVVLTPKGEEDLSNNYPGQFELEDITALVSDIQGNHEFTAEQKAEKETEVYGKYEEKGKRIRSFEQLMKAYVLFQVDVDYVVSDDKVVIVDEFTGRLMPGRRFSDGIHEALEAKENVRIQKESQTLATITFQNYFRMYKKLSGMTGTADTEAMEFHEIYKLDVIVAPTNKSLVRKDYPDVIYKTEKEKFNAVIGEIEKLYSEGRPVLVGTVSIDVSEKLGSLLKKRKIPHEVLNAKYHEREAEIIKLAGQRNSVTIATNMAGRGTDIVLGPGIADLGGLHVIGTERHESRRIDNQLRGRAGRQGDPGSSRFYLSLEDSLMRIFGSDRIAMIMEKLGMEEGQDIQHPLITRAIGTAQKRVENHNFEIRKWLLKYDKVMNRQREVIYSYRNLILEEQDLRNYLFDSVDYVLTEILDSYYQTEEEEDNVGILLKNIFENFRILLKKEDIENNSRDKIYSKVMGSLEKDFDKRKESLGQEMFLGFMKWRMLDIVDRKWKDHLYAMDELRESVGLRAYGQKDPLIEYQNEGHKMFISLMNQVKYDSVKEFFFSVVAQFKEEDVKKDNFENAQYVHPEFTNAIAQASGEQEGSALNSASIPEPYTRRDKKVGRNDLCPCGSGQKYKKCCGR